MQSVGYILFRRQRDTSRREIYKTNFRKHMGASARQQSHIIFRMEREQLRAASLFFQTNAEDSAKGYCHCRKTNEQLALQNEEGVSGSMKSWSEKKKEIQSIDPVRVNELEAVAQLVNAIHRRRVELGWTQKELADKVGLHQESIARIENGGSVPRLDTVFRLAIALGLELKLQNREEAAAVSAG